MKMFSFTTALSFLLLWIFTASDGSVDLSRFIQRTCIYQKKIARDISTSENVIKCCLLFYFLGFSEVPGELLVKSH